MLLDMIREDLVAERIAIQSYAEIARRLGNDDSTMRTLKERSSRWKEEHADDLRSVLATARSEPEAAHGGVRAR